MTSTSIQSTWRGQALVIAESRLFTRAGIGVSAFAGTHEEIWSLDSEGQLVIVITDQETGAAPIIMRFVYQRQR